MAPNDVGTDQVGHWPIRKFPKAGKFVKLCFNLIMIVTIICLFSTKLRTQYYSKFSISVPVLIVQMVVSLFVGMPIYMILMFLGNYSRKSLFTFWECVPALKGKLATVTLH